VRSQPVASIVIPTRRRPGYLDVALASVMGQARSAGAEVLVVSDGPDDATRVVAARHDARLIALPQPRGVNGARNAGIQSTLSDLTILLDDDVEVPAGWLHAMLTGVRGNPECEVLGGPIRARLEGGGPRACGREPAPISTYDFGSRDRDVPFIFGGNTAIRQQAFERVGYFQEDLSGRGDEEEWVLRFTTSGGRIRYLAAAYLDHRRTPEDARLHVLTRAAYRQGREVHRHNLRIGQASEIRTALRVLAGCAWHTIRRRCAYGIVMGARAAGTLREALTVREALTGRRP
jgi:GT2 family glycosyltransferase